MRTTGERKQRRRSGSRAGGITGRAAARLGGAVAAGLCLALAVLLGATALADDTHAAARPAAYGGAPSDDLRPLGDGAATVAGAASFALASGVRADLIALWDASIVANEERVACIGGTRGRDGVVHISRVYALPVVGADSANAGAGPSLATCRPPTWFGTVHTHIITDPLGEPYTQFSSPDRDVIARWRRAWRTDGVFCLLYSEADAHCELGGGQAAANVTYALGGNEPTVRTATAYSSADASAR
jgi:hypothetical protein